MVRVVVQMVVGVVEQHEPVYGSVWAKAACYLFLLHMHRQAWPSKKTCVVVLLITTREVANASKT